MEGETLESQRLELSAITVSKTQQAPKRAPVLFQAHVGLTNTDSDASAGTADLTRFSIAHHQIGPNPKPKVNGAGA
jgi:hypothetical protein